jgi:amino acid adenylation domain-containing protein
MDGLLHSYLTVSAEKYAEKPAVIYQDNKISYRDLHNLSTQLSTSLMHKGVKRGDRVGIYIDKSIESVIAIFAVLRSGACYVPLDPLGPPERQVLIANDCSFECLVTSSKKIPQVRKILEQAKTLKNIFVLDKNRDEFKGETDGIDLLFKDDIFGAAYDSQSESGQGVAKEDVAYILYTSGSTGQPKGVMLSHKAAEAFVDWSLKTFVVQSDDIVSSHAPFHFDLSVFDLFVTIKAGAAICLVPQGLSSFPKSVVDFIEKHNISIWYSVPSILTQLVLHGDLEKQKLPSLRQILFAGEVFPSKYLRRLMELMPDVKYCNLYGPTETNVITYYHVASLPELSGTIPIGALCDGVKSYIVDGSGSLVKEGEKGELYVTCPTLMDGYWNDARKTESVVLKNIYAPDSEELLYKTGDIVSSNDNGDLEYHGRCDAMIKSRGYRIELGEVETALAAHPGLREAAVTAVPDDKIGNKIKAVVVTKNEGEISENDVKGFCSRKLPHYMIPEIISIIKALPRTSTGKVDRKKLKEENI